MGGGRIARLICFLVVAELETVVEKRDPLPQIVRPDVPQREARLMRGRLSISWMINPADGIPLVMIYWLGVEKA